MREPQSHDTRTSLLERVKNTDDHQSWQEFYSIYGKLIQGQAIRAGFDNDETKDVVQETLIEVARHMPTFHYDRQRGSFKAWLFQLTRWRIINRFQKRSLNLVSIEAMQADRDNAVDFHHFLSALAVKPDQTWEQDWREALVTSALRRLRNRWNPKPFQAIDLLFTKHWSASRVCETLHLSRAHLYVLKFRALRQIKKEMARLETSSFHRSEARPPRYR